MKRAKKNKKKKEPLVELSSAELSQKADLIKVAGGLSIANTDPGIAATKKKI